jgi:hypothetical protein
MGFTRPGKLTVSFGKWTFYSWVNPLFLWPVSIAMFVYQRVSNFYGWLKNVVWNFAPPTSSNQSTSVVVW